MLHSGDPVSAGGSGQCDEVLPLDQLVIGQPTQSISGETLGVGSARLVRDYGRRVLVLAEHVAAGGEEALREVGHRGWSIHDEVIEQSRKQLLRNAGSSS
jgi:hypothetical protein